MRTKVTLVLLFLNVALFFFIFRFERRWRTDDDTLVLVCHASPGSQTAGFDQEDGRFNLRTRAVTIAFLRKLLNYSALERAEAELQEWLAERA